MPRKQRTEGKRALVESRTLSDQVYQILRTRILHRHYEAGKFIREQDIGQELGVSRTPVREACSRLASQDFLERVPHRGFRVPERSWESLLEVYPIITALEMLAGTLAFSRLTPADTRRLRELNQKLQEAGAAGDAKRGAELNNSFHEVLSRRSGNQKLSELLDQLRTQVTLLDVWYFSVPEHVEQAVREHDEIVDSLEANDQERALRMLERNYIRGQQALEQELSRTNGTGPAA